MNRKDFISNSLLIAASLASGVKAKAEDISPVVNEKWKMRFAPHIGLTQPDDFMFPEMAAKNPVDQIKFVADMSFSGIEDNFLQWRPVEMQVKIG